MTNLELKKELQAIANKKEKSIEKEVAYDALNYDQKCESFFLDMQNIDSSTAIANYFIFYTDTDAFFDRHCNQIKKLRKEFETKNDTVLEIKGTLNRNLSWFAFEKTTLKMAQELGLEI